MDLSVFGTFGWNEPDHSDNLVLENEVTGAVVLLRQEQLKGFLRQCMYVQLLGKPGYLRGTETTTFIPSVGLPL